MLFFDSLIFKSLKLFGVGEKTSLNVVIILQKQKLHQVSIIFPKGFLGLLRRPFGNILTLGLNFILLCETASFAGLLC